MVMDGDRARGITVQIRHAGAEGATEFRVQVGRSNALPDVLAEEGENLMAPAFAVFAFLGIRVHRRDSTGKKMGLQEGDMLSPKGKFLSP